MLELPAKLELPGMENETSKYEFVRKLGAGTYGVTKLFREKATGELIAVKLLKRGKELQNNITYVEREVLNHRYLTGHPNLVGVRELLLYPEELGIVMEYAAGGELFDCIMAVGCFTEGVARYFFQQMVSGLAWCHRNGVCHRDLKLENMVLDKPVPVSVLRNNEALLRARPCLKICDFGYSKSVVLDSIPNSTVGTPTYIAPEVFTRAEYNGELADVWSCGVALYVMLTGGYPFIDPDDPRNSLKTMERIVAVNYTIPKQLGLSSGCVDLLHRIFKGDPATRITLQQIMNHAWFKKNLPAQKQVIQQVQFLQTEEEMQLLMKQACVLENEEVDVHPKKELLVKKHHEMEELDGARDGALHSSLHYSVDLLVDELLRTTARTVKDSLHRKSNPRNGTDPSKGGTQVAQPSSPPSVGATRAAAQVGEAMQEQQQQQQQLVKWLPAPSRQPLSTPPAQQQDTQQARASQPAATAEKGGCSCTIQ